jgi:hypothetical protein
MAIRSDSTPGDTMIFFPLNGAPIALAAAPAALRINCALDGTRLHGSHAISFRRRLGCLFYLPMLRRESVSLVPQRLIPRPQHDLIFNRNMPILHPVLDEWNQLFRQ